MLNSAETEIVATQEELCQLVEVLGRESLFACDLEADSLHHYQERVCLLQFATPSVAVLLDPLPLHDLSPLAEVLGNPAIRKIFHGADYDIRSLHRDFSLEVHNLFDTMIACQFLGEREFGLAAVLRKRFGAELDKKYQKADWSRRPLSSGMIEYAVKDTLLLIGLYQQLEQELRAKGRLSWVEEESALLSRVRSAPRCEESFYLRFKGASKMSPRTLAVLDELLRYRDRQARNSDIPPFKILGTETVRELAEKRPRTVADLPEINGLSRKLVERHGNGILQAVSRGMALTDTDLPVFPLLRREKRSRAQEDRLKALKEWREKKAGKLGIDMGVLANNALLEALSVAHPQSLEELDEIPAMRVWQKQEFGEEVLQLIA